MIIIHVTKSISLEVGKKLIQVKESGKVLAMFDIENVKDEPKFSFLNELENNSRALIASIKPTLQKKV